MWHRDAVLRAYQCWVLQDGRGEGKGVEGVEGVELLRGRGASALALGVGMQGRRRTLPPDGTRSGGNGPPVGSGEHLHRRVQSLSRLL
jgi:hypothetical protein